MYDSGHSSANEGMSSVHEVRSEGLMEQGIPNVMGSINGDQIEESDQNG